MKKGLIKPEMAAGIISALTERYGTALRNERLVVDGYAIGDNVHATLELANTHRTFVYTMEAAVIRSKHTAMSVTDALDLCVDFLNWYVGEFIREQRELLLPLDWQPHRFGDVEVLAKGELRNELLDDAADAWLRGERPDIETQWRALKGAEIKPN